MAIHIPIILKGLAVAGKSKAVHAAGAAATKRALPKLLIGLGITGLIGAKLALFYGLCRQRHLFKNPEDVGYTCDHCQRWINVKDLVRKFNSSFGKDEPVYSGKCPGCQGFLTILDSKLQEK